MSDQSRIELLHRVEPQVSKPVADGAVPDSWWARIEQAFGNFTPDAKAAFTHDTHALACEVLPQAKDAISENWPASRIRTGVVVGSVQSGKTASMLGLSALLLDRGVGLLVVLAGTRIALWLQTYERLLTQLDGSTPETAWRRNKERVLVPAPEDILSADARAETRAYLRFQRRQVEKALQEGRPCLFVVPKEDAHLLELGRLLRELLSPALLDARSHPLDLVVLDDEADDASVLAAATDKVTPKFIQELWSIPGNPDVTWHPRLRAVYVAYTATPQANLLQASHNPLSPRDFFFALRTPDQVGAVVPRQLTFTERVGIRRYYTGGRTFYERLRGRPGDFCCTRPYPVQGQGEPAALHDARVARERWHLLGDALRSYFIGGALRLYLGKRRLSTLPLAPVSEGALRAVLPDPHVMLYHPSALKDLHFQGAEDISRWSAAKPGEEARTKPAEVEEGRFVLDVQGLVARLSSEESAWRGWVDQFDLTSGELQTLPGGTYPSLAGVPWEAIRELLVTEIFPHTKLRVLNSDPRADDRPVFSPVRVDEPSGTFLPPHEIYSIFVAGNILSRGLTLEGLSTSLFLRSSREPAADTQMQMQRWFGYRGSHLPFCRVFLFEDQLALFRSYHANDEALKQEILRRSDVSTPPDRVLVLAGERFVATAKVETRHLPLHPGPTPAIRIVEHENDALIQANTDLVVQFLTGHEVDVIEAPVGTVRGLITREPIGMFEVADLLDGLCYSYHDPDPTHEVYARWRSLEVQLGLGVSLLRTPGKKPSACLTG